MDNKNLTPHQATLDKMLVSIPGVKAGKAFGYPAYKINGKVFAFISQGLVLKLPENRVLEVIASDPSIRPFEPGDSGIVWREWIFISRETSEAHHQDTTLMEEAAAYVASKA